MWLDHRSDLNCRLLKSYARLLYAFSTQFSVDSHANLLFEKLENVHFGSISTFVEEKIILIFLKIYTIQNPNDVPPIVLMYAIQLPLGNMK